MIRLLLTAFLVILFLLPVRLSLAQSRTEPDTTSAGQIITPYESYYKAPRVFLHVHFNKSRYMAGEDIWYKIYLKDAPGNSFHLPVNVYAELFDAAGRTVNRQVLLAAEGSAYAHIPLDDSLPSGKYIFRAYTNWMKNFSDSLYYEQIIDIAGLSSDSLAEAPARSARRTGYDIQFLPESGIILSDVLNHIGIKALSPGGKGTALKGTLKNGAGDAVAALETNQLGTGSFSAKFSAGASYEAVWELPDGDSLRISFPEVQAKGVLLTTQSFFPDHVAAFLVTNELSLPEISGKRFLLMVHNQGQVAIAAYMSLKENTSGKLEIPKENMLGGINHITVFDETHQPVADRMVFVQKPERFATANVRTRRIGRDSVFCEVESTGPGAEPLPADISISWLPAGTKAGDFRRTIYSTFLLEADLYGQVENPAWYFEDMNDFGRKKALDDLLLTQGWRRYEWNRILDGKIPTIVHPLEQGLSIRGRVVNSISQKGMERSQVSLFSAENSLLTSAEVEEDGSFEFPNLYLLDTSRVILSASNEKGKRGFRELKAEVTKPAYDRRPAEPVPGEMQAPDSTDTFTSIAVVSGVEMLEGVTVTGQAVKEDPFESSIYRSMNDRVVEITKDNYNQYIDVPDLLRKAFNVQVSQAGGNLSINMGRGGGQPAIIIDDMVMQDASWLTTLNIMDIEAVAVNKSGNAMLGTRGGNGSISIKTRTEGIDWGEQENISVKNILVEGFARPAEYYAPDYQVPPESDLFKEYAAVYWKPDIRTDSTGTASFGFTIPESYSDLHMRLEGISADGKLLFDDKTIHLSGN